MPPRPDFKRAALQATSGYSTEDLDRLIGAPVIVVSAPRSGSTLLFEQLRKLPNFWSIGGESHAIFREFPHLRAENAQLDSMALTAAHADARTADLLKRLFLLFVRDHTGQRFLETPQDLRPGQICLLEKTPRNALNIPFLLNVFPRARFVFLYRDPRENISSLIEAWTAGLRTGGFVTFRNLPDWHLPAWCFLLPRGWRALQGASIPEIAAFQWAASNAAIIESLRGLERTRWHAMTYADLIADPSATLASIATFSGTDPGAGALQVGDMALSHSTVSPPKADKWQRHASELHDLEPVYGPIWTEIEAFASS